jgi:hypothetical protein
VGYSLQVDSRQFQPFANLQGDGLRKIHARSAEPEETAREPRALGLWLDHARFDSGARSAVSATSVGSEALSSPERL